MSLHIVLNILSRSLTDALEQADFSESVDLALRCRTWMSHRLLGGSAQARSERLAISSSLKKTAVQYQRTRRPVLRTKPADQAEDRRHRNRLKNRIPRNTAKYGRSDLVGNARLLSFVPKLFSPRVAPSSGQRGGGRQVYFKSLTVSGGVRSPRVQRSALLAARTILERTTEVGRCR